MKDNNDVISKNQKANCNEDGKQTVLERSACPTAFRGNEEQSNAATNANIMPVSKQATVLASRDLGKYWDSLSKQNTASFDGKQIIPSMLISDTVVDRNQTQGRQNVRTDANSLVRAALGNKGRFYNNTKVDALFKVII